MSEDQIDADDKVEPTVRYLQKLGSNHLDLIFDASKWVFDVDRKLGLQVRALQPSFACLSSLSAQVFVADYEEVESLPRHAVMRHLDGIGADVCRDYLEYIIHTLGEDGPEFHEKLIELYLARVREEKSDENKGALHAFVLCNFR